MKHSILNHNKTPLFLKVVNSKLAACLMLNGGEFSTTDFQTLISLRHKVVTRFLCRLNSEEKKAFAKKEIFINKKLEELARGLLENAKDDAVKFSRGRTAVKKYK